MQHIGNHLNIPGNQNEESQTGEERQHHHPYQQHSYPQPSTLHHHQNPHYIHLQPQHHHQQQQQQQQQQHQQLQIQQPSQPSEIVVSSRLEKRLKVERDGTILARRCSDPTEESPMEGVELSRKMPTSVSSAVGCASSGGSTTAVGGNNKKGKRGKKSTRIDLNAKLERSRQSARECRARKKLRYQYLEDLVNKREKAVFSLRKELDTYKDWCKQVDDGADPKEALVALHLDKQTDFLKPT